MKVTLSICLGFVVMALAYMQATPALEAPDEGSHFLYIHNLLETGELPILEDRDTVKLSQSAQRHHPPLYYLIGAGLIFWTDRNDVEDFIQPNPFAVIGMESPNNQNVFLHSPQHQSGDTATAIWILRLYSVALACGTLWFIGRAIALAFGSKVMAWLTMALVAVIPSYIFIGASINNDNLVTFCFSAGVYWTIRIWQNKKIALFDMVCLGLILSGVALSKISGLGLFGVVYPVLLLAGVTGRIKWQRVTVAILVSWVIVLLLAGWWYVRNWSLYGDPLAIDATSRIWSRGKVVWSSDQIWHEVQSVWVSVWMMLGHLNVSGPDWFYDYVDGISVVGVVGVVWGWWINRKERFMILLLAGVGGLVIAALAFATRRINVSQGRILFPGMVAYAALLVYGWTALGGRKLAGLLILPLAIVSLTNPLLILAKAYSGAEVVAAVPPLIQRVDAQAESLHLFGYQLHTSQVEPGGIVALDLFVQGGHKRDPILFVKALDPVSYEPVGGVDTYPGMVRLSQIDPTAIYRVPVRFQLDEGLSARPRQLLLLVGWRIPEPDNIGAGVYLSWVDAQRIPLEALLLTGPTLIDKNYRVSTPQVEIDLLYGDAIRLVGYSCSTATLAPRDELTVTLYWQYRTRLTEDWTVALGIVGIDGALADGMVPGYPTSAWREGPAFTDTRTISIPMNVAPGQYSLYIGWYDLKTGQRLPVEGENVENNLYITPAVITVQSGD